MKKYEVNMTEIFPAVTTNNKIYVVFLFEVVERP